MRCALRTVSKDGIEDNYPELVSIADISSSTDWSTALEDCNIVIHTAARVHIMKDAALDPLKEFREVNVEGTLNLARQAAQQGIKRFIFISSVKVNGGETSLGKIYGVNDLPNPDEPMPFQNMRQKRV